MRSIRRGVARVHGRTGRGALRLLAALVALSAGAPAVQAADPGIDLAIDRERFALVATDLRSGDAGPEIRVAIGSPADPTPNGRFAVDRVILNPRWRPGETARAAGVRDRPPSLETPMGVAKIPFAARGAIALHGGGDSLLLGKPVSSGCVRADDADLLRLIAWLQGQEALGPAASTADGEVHRRFTRPVRILVR